MVLNSLEDLDSLISSDFNEDIYGTSEIHLDCLLPTGIYIPLTVDRWASVKQVKERLWREAFHFPLYDVLNEADQCVFVYINSFGEREEISDETRQISTIQPFLSVLKVIRKEKRNVEKNLTSEIGSLIGKHDFDSLRDEEIIEFRRGSKQLCEKINAEKTSVRDLNQMISFVHPPDICEELDVLHRISEVLQPRDNKFLIEIKYDQTNGNRGTHRLFMSADKYPDDIISNALDKQHHHQSRMGKHNYDLHDYVLKIVGREEYLLPDEHSKPRPLYKYTYIYRKIMKQEAPQLTLVKKTDIIRPKAPPRSTKTSNPIDLPPRTLKRKPKRDPHADLWEINSKFSFRVVGSTQLNCEDDSAVYLKAALYHGVETICDVKDTEEVLVRDCSADFDEKLEFDIAVCDLPRMTRLCLSLYVRTAKLGKGANKRAIAKSANTKDSDPLAWVNMCVFDFKSRLCVGQHMLHMWSYDEFMISSDSSVSTNHLGTSVSNPQAESTTLLLRFSHFGHRDRPIVYPTLEAILECAAKQLGNENEYGVIGGDEFGNTEEETKAQLGTLLQNRSPLKTWHVQDHEQIWAMKVDIPSSYRHSLPVLLTCFRWDSHTDVAQMQALLQSWPLVDVDTALELLDCMYPDQNVRHFAVKCLREFITDTELCRYLLQLVQALKFESYLECELVYFLLERAIKNRKIGHYLFWLLKSEMHVPSVSVRFGLILEAYCQGSADHVPLLRKQDDIMSKLLAVHRYVKSEENRTRGHESMRDILSGYEYSEGLIVASSPLDPALRLSTLKVDKCKYMDSKMKPLWLVWSNGCKYGEDVQIIFKKGDDLRQDMLTLQVLGIMDNIWLSQGLDLRLASYECLATGRDVGMVGVIDQADTIANIQKQFSNIKLKAAFNKESLYKWLQLKNPDPTSLANAVHEFTLSCAGSCVATYVLGIADRHSDNIMLRQTGQLCHIDFGHFLGRFKSKFGIKRERVPFILTHDFLHIISMDTANTPGNEKPFDQFKKLCEQAYMLLRKKGNLLISLFMMMLSTGIPELRSVSDLKYLQDTLVLDYPEDKALKHFRSKFKEALNNSWKASMNWAIHNAARDNN